MKKVQVMFAVGAFSAEEARCSREATGLVKFSLV